MSKNKTKPRIPIEYIDRLFNAQREAVERGLFEGDKNLENLELLISISNITDYRNRKFPTIPVAFPTLFKNKEDYDFVLQQLIKMKMVDQKTLLWKPGFRNAVPVGILKELQTKYFNRECTNIELALIANRFFDLPLSEDHFKDHPETDLILPRTR